MKQVGSHLQKYLALGERERGERSVVVDVVDGVVGVRIEEKQVQIKNDTIFFTVPAPLKTKIHEMKREVISAIKKAGVVVVDIA